MTQWLTGVACPRRCGGRLYATMELTTKKRALYSFLCNECAYSGAWSQLARVMKTTLRRR